MGVYRLRVVVFFVGVGARFSSEWYKKDPQQLEQNDQNGNQKEYYREKDIY